MVEVGDYQHSQLNMWEPQRGSFVFGGTVVDCQICLERQGGLVGRMIMGTTGATLWASIRGSRLAKSPVPPSRIAFQVSSRYR